MLLDWLARKNQHEKFASAAKIIESAIDSVLQDPSRRTFDLGGALGTRAFTKALSEEIGRHVG
jgi:3-isopropylmalate dehydrogenase